MTFFSNQKNYIEIRCVKMQNIILSVYTHHLILFFQQSTSLIIPKEIIIYFKY